MSGIFIYIRFQFVNLRYDYLVTAAGSLGAQLCATQSIDRAIRVRVFTDFALFVENAFCEVSDKYEV